MLKFPSSSFFKNLGFTIDCYLPMNVHVSNIVMTCYFELSRLASIHGFLASAATASLVSDFVCQELTTVAHWCLILIMM